MRKLNVRERFIFALMIATCGLFATDCWVWRPIHQASQSLDDAIEAKESELQHDEELLAVSNQIKKDYAAFSSVYREGGTNNSSSGITTILKEIESVAQRSGIKINTIKPQSAQGRSSGNSAVFLSIESAWDPLVHFIYQIQRSPQLLEIQKADLQGKGEDGAIVTGQFVIAQNP